MPGTASRRAVVCLNLHLHRALRLKVVKTSRSVSELVSDAVGEAFVKDAEDIIVFEQRAAQPLINYDKDVYR